MSKLLHTRNILRLHENGHSRPRLRRSKPICEKCSSLNHRVLGPACIRCGLRYRTDVVQLDTDSRRAQPWL
jgi:hypothetical protein